MQLKNFSWLFTLIIAVFFAFPIKAQVTIGDQTEPHSFSVMELSTEKVKGGLRMPQLTTHQRDSIKEILLGDVDLATAANGLAIYNIDTNCLEFWEKTRWVSLCSSILVAPIGVTISPTEMTIPVLSTTPLIATLTPANATATQYRWEYSFNKQDWLPVEDGVAPAFAPTASPVSKVAPMPTGSSTIDAMARLVGDMWYRVIAYNDAGSVISNIARITGVMSPVNGGNNPTFQMYTGAFWRWSERGERLIQFDIDKGKGNDGSWAASVIWYDDNWNPYNNSANPDGVVLANNSSPLSLPLSDMNAENHPVTNGSQLITGSVADGGTISFRIGLDKQFADSNNFAARYAVVLLSYNNGNKKYKLFIRQGEGADYVMRPEDFGESGESWGTPANPRPKAVKFIPYNVTDPSRSTPTNWGNAISITPTTSRFTDFPTKAGYFFMENDNKAFAPDIPVGAISAWNRGRGTKVTGGYWSPTLESCPSGYHRPSDGPNDTGAFGAGAVAGSEMRQSLWVNPPSGTNSNVDYSNWGYYADGYFDRRKLENSLTIASATYPSSSTPNSAVNTNSVDVAYEGRLFFNPITNASLFFPAAGTRFDMEGSLFNSGGRARYWTSTSYSVTNQQGSAWFLFLYTNTDGTTTAMYYDSEATAPTPPVDNSKTAGALMRCVKQ